MKRYDESRYHGVDLDYIFVVIPEDKIEFRASFEKEGFLVIKWSEIGVDCSARFEDWLESQKEEIVPLLETTMEATLNLIKDLKGEENAKRLLNRLSKNIKS